MKQALQLRLGQHLTMTPQLQQAIKLLQLSTLELQQEIQEALDSNLMLEVAEDADSENQAKTNDTKEETTDATASDEQAEQDSTQVDTTSFRSTVAGMISMKIFRQPAARPDFRTRIVNRSLAIPARKVFRNIYAGRCSSRPFLIRTY